MDEQRFRILADETFRRIMDGFDSLDTEDADVETAGNTLTITFPSGERCVVNTQAATRQIWLAGGKSAWHFTLEPETGRWLHDKGTGDELLAVLSRITREAIGQTPAFP
jgi:iron donor protein CyaY